jgi:raffinose/stachyose/melibiose transport system substrate-binding protein
MAGLEPRLEPQSSEGGYAMSPREQRRQLTRRHVLRTTGAAGALAAAGALGSGRRARGQEAVTLSVWDGYVRPGESALMDRINSEFQDAHPGVTIERTVRTFDDLKTTIRLAMSSEDGPDVGMVNQGLSDMGAMAAAGLLRDLGPYAEQYGWYDLLSPSLVARNSFAENGTVFGEGTFYGMPPTAEFVGIIFNREKIEAAGGVPATFGDLEALLVALQEGGEIPIAFGNLDGWPAIHIYGELQNLGVDREYLDNFIYGRNDVSFAIPENTEAAAIAQAWVEAGYFTPDFSGIGYDDSWPAFSTGQGGMMITGSWLSGELEATGVADQFGFILFPPREAGASKLSVAGTSMGFAIRETSTQPDLAAEYIDWTVSDRAAELWAEAGIVSVNADPALVEGQEGIYAELVRAWDQLNSTDTVGHYPDWATPTLYNTLVASLQELFGLAITPEEFTAQIEADYAAYLAEKNA